MVCVKSLSVIDSQLDDTLLTKSRLWSQFLLSLSVRDEPWRILLNEANQGWGHSSPNPSVGCVILDRQGQLMASAHHQKAGEPHAEVLALQKIGLVTKSADGLYWIASEQLKKQVEGATIYVTLEPCAHVGRTPPCAQLLSDLPIKKIIAVLQDPNPLVAGRGLAQLQSAGKSISCLERDHPTHPVIPAVRIIHSHFLESVTRQSPVIWLKWASSYDGFMTNVHGRSQWLTSHTARLLGRTFRGLCDGILTTANTVIHDQASMDLRDTEFAYKAFPLFIWDSQLRCLNFSQLPIWSRRAEGGVYLIADAEHLGIKEGIYVLTADTSFLPQKFHGSWKNIMAHTTAPIRILAGPSDFRERWFWFLNCAYHDLKHQSLWVEGGPRFTRAILENELWDYGLHFQALKWLGQGHSPGPLGHQGRVDIPEWVFAKPLVAQALESEFMLLFHR